MRPTSRRTPHHPRYAILRRLGSGGSGSVYLARDLLEEGREVAFKVCHLHAAPEGLLREFRILRELRHPGIARAFDFGRLPDGRSAYFTLEHVAGPDLEGASAALRRVPWPESAPRFLEVFLQVTAALDYLHRKGLLHLDLKPANVVLSGGEPKLIDFGLFQNARWRGKGIPRGTAYFTAPEVFTEGKADERSDLYSLGVTFYRSLTGAYPIGGRDLPEISRHHQGLTPRPPRGVPEGLSRIVLKLLAKSPDRRFQSAGEVWNALRDLDLASGQETRPPAPLEPDLVGRKRELEQLFAWFDDLRQGRGERVFLIEGESGIGKSRFAEACVTEILGLGARVIPLQGYGGKDAASFRSLIQKLLTLFPLRRGDAVRSRFLLAVLGLESDAQSQREIGELELEPIRARAFREAFELLAARASSPLVFVIDDADRADAELRDFAARLAAEPAPDGRAIPAGILATCHPGTLAAGAELPAGGGFRRLLLERLGRAEVKALIESLRPAAVKDAGRLRRWSRGNPGVLIQCLQGTALEPPSRRQRAASLPDWRAAAALRLGELSADSRQVLLDLAVLERPAAEGFLRKLAGFRPGRFRAALARLERAGLLKRTPGGVYLSASMPREAVLSGVDPEALAAAHARIGARLREDPARRREAAQHLLQGGRLEEGVAAAEEAASELRKAGRVEEALAACEEALAHTSGAARLRMGEEIGGLEDRRGRVDEAARRYQEALAAGEVPPPARLRLHRKLGGVLQRRGDNEAALRAFDAALECLDLVADIEEHLHLFNELSALHLFRGDFARAATFANRGLEILGSPAARTLAPQAAAFHALNFHSAAGHILLRQFEYDRAIAEFLRGLRFAEKIGSLSNTALILNNCGIAYHQSNRLGKALKVYGRAGAIARSLGDRTALFSILSNVAQIRARLGEMRAAEEILREVEDLPLAAQSKRARLFLLYSRGLLLRLLGKDARSTWEDAVRLADELPDPLFARYGRLYLFQNEVQEGRWAAARTCLTQLEAAAGKDARFDQALSVRRAHLEAVVGHTSVARAILAAGSRAGGQLHYGDLWDGVFAAAAFIEIGELANAERILREAKGAFDRSRQVPGSLECALLLADLKLRARDPAAAAGQLKEARRLLALHDTSRGSRNAAVWIPYLEARAALQDRRAARSYVADRLVDAAGNLSHGSQAEVVWLLDLTAAENAGPAARRKLAAARQRFAASLAPADRPAYLARDHRARLGLGEPPATRGVLEAAGEGALLRERYETLVALAGIKDPAAALEAVLRAAGATRGAVFLEGEPRLLATMGLGPERRIEKLRAAALGAANAAAGRGFSAELRSLGGRRAGVLYAEPADLDRDPGAAKFLQAAARVFPLEIAPGGAYSGAPPATPALLKEPLRTETLDAGKLVESAAPRMQEVLQLIRRTRDSRLPLLLTGESGVGKDHLARWIHLLSPRSQGPFVAQDCSAIPAGLLEAEIFGYEEGAFTGATRRRTGYLFAAQGGTFYLDNVDSLPLEVQAKLIRVLAEEAARPLGSRRAVRADVRFIASSQRDLKELSRRGEFRKDLYFRLAGITLNVPPLRERAEDIVPLIRHFQRQIPGNALEFTPGAIEALKAHAWPGNVRELESLVRRLSLTAEAAVDEERVRKVLGLGGAPQSFPRWVFDGRSYEQVLDEVKREYLLHLFEKFEGSIERVAKALGTTKRNVYLRFSQLGIRPVELRQAR